VSVRHSPTDMQSETAIPTYAPCAIV